MEFDYDEKARHYQKRFGDLRQKEYLPYELVDLVERTAFTQLDALRDAQVVIPAPEDITGEEENLQGKPLLPRESFTWDAGQAEGLFADLSAMLKKQSGPMGEAADIISKAAEAGEFKLPDIFAAFVLGDEAVFEEWGAKTPEAPRAMAFLVQASLTPSIQALAAELAKNLTTERSRSHGHCPVCGSMPLITNLRNKEGLRFATCSFCRTEYRIRRLACPLCDEDDHTKLHFYDVKEERGYRVDTCDSCRMYIKGADFRQLDKVCVPVLDDLESLPLDFLAMEQGFARATMSAWGF